MPSPPERTAAEFQTALQALLPPGVVWPRETGSALGQILQGVAVTAARLRARADALLVDAFPATAYELLPEWEAALGLPDPCAGPAPSLQQRRGQVVARLTARGGQTPAYFIERAAQLGYTVSIRQYAPSRLGTMRMGDRMRHAAWAHAWAIRAPSTTVRPFRMGQSGLGERFRSWGNAVLECELRSVAPAHTIPLFQYV
jgi:uncharacterized protein YmfQ (DUF2313 family)